jgi:ABC-type polysaccharide/polyol phosphate transport system ATPase subunit
MHIRLAFAIATVEPVDILVMDEIIGAGDEKFRLKIEDKMFEYISNTKALLLSTHDINLALRICNKALLLKNGSMVAQGPVEEVVAKYKATL